MSKEKAFNNRQSQPQSHLLPAPESNEYTAISEQCKEQQQTHWLFPTPSLSTRLLGFPRPERVLVDENKAV
jgi:hypothetical protein